MTALLVLKIVGVAAAASGIIGAMIEWGPGRSRDPWQRKIIRKPGTFSHFLVVWATGFVLMAGFALLVVWYLGPRR